MIVRLLGIASVADAAWQLVDRRGWTRFWGKSLVKLRKPTPAATALAAGELLLGTWLLVRGGASRAARGGTVAKFRVSRGHHPITAT
jgi:hypothetical protein